MKVFIVIDMKISLADDKSRWPISAALQRLLHALMMIELFLRLKGGKPPSNIQKLCRLREMYSQNIRKVHRKLRSEYGDFAHYNKRNPLDELLFIICSVRTSEAKYVRSYKDIKREFPSFWNLYEATEEELEKLLEPSGLSKIKSRQMKEILSYLVAEYSKPTLSPLKKYSDEECEAFLTSLPGVGKKTARCVMMYSLDREVFPVDTHCWRIATRLGWMEQGMNAQVFSEREMDLLQNMIPKRIRFSLHVNMVSHGREVCRKNNPRCADCTIKRYCQY